MAKLTKDQWADIRRRWETDPRDGHQWLADELTGQGVEINRAAIAKAAGRQGWAKREPENVTPKNVTQNVTQNVTLSDKTPLQKVTPAPAKNMALKAIPEPVWEEVDETSLHGNTKYLSAFDRQAHLLCRLGATDAELAEFFKVSEQTINNWKRMYVTFFESIKTAKMWADAEAANGLFKRATGYRYKEVKTKAVRPMSESDDDGGIQAAGDESLLVVEVVTTEKEVPPDTSAAFLWLKNRRPKDWRDKVEVEATHKLTPDMMERLKTEMVDRLTAARERQRQVLIDRGLIDE